MLHSEVGILFLCLFAGHLLGDFVLQTSEEAARKREWGVLLRHSFKVGFVSYAVTGCWRRLDLLVTVFVLHAIIDWTKAHWGGVRRLRPFLLDQLAHVVVLVALAVSAARFGQLHFWWQAEVGRNYVAGLVLLSGLILVVRTGGIGIGLAVAPLLEEIEAVRRERLPDPDSLKGSPPRGLKAGGRLIGMLERFLILVFVLSGLYSGIGFLIAAKSIFRFGELKDRENRQEAEYITIGTLMSVSYAIVVSLLTRWLLGIL